MKEEIEQMSMFEQLEYLNFEQNGFFKKTVISDPLSADLVI